MTMQRHQGRHTVGAHGAGSGDDIAVTTPHGKVEANPERNSADIAAGRCVPRMDCAERPCRVADGEPPSEANVHANAHTAATCRAADAQ
eukprot:CAMPEP_0174829006 /NCGR_PEP_ID=MMETSP1114-20130205/1666_1 /TAXON_ID=312471 /ORGANISM="Neobodo designis, Strain CCAP 1951/1" /LENGTH=88 /DNA_ID=CAMNT_0016062739 /DNA_START=295 /DNA_END=559 /DNA_ORIENTATION=+